MQATTNESESEPVPSKPANAKPPDIASASVPDTLAALKVNPETGLAHAEVDVAVRSTATTKWPRQRGIRPSNS